MLRFVRCVENFVEVLDARMAFFRADRVCGLWPSRDVLDDQRVAVGRAAERPVRWLHGVPVLLDPLAVESPVGKTEVRPGERLVAGCRRIRNNRTCADS